MNTLTPPSPEAISSIGAVWPPVPASDNRMRGFYPELIDHSRIDSFTKELKDQDFFFHHSSQSATRLSTRIVAPTLVVPHIAKVLNSSIEAAIPLGGEHAGNHIVYFGTARSYRGVGEDYQEPAATVNLGKSLGNLKEAQQRLQVPLPSDRELSARGLRLAVAERTMDDDTAAQFTDLYQPFGYGQADVAELAANPNNTILYLQNEEGVITSSAMAERAQIDIEGLGTIHMVEITEATTNPDYRGQGHYRMVSGFLLRHILEQAEKDDTPVHAIYGESNLDPSAVGVLRAGTENGRRFSFSDAAGLGVSNDDRDVPFGILPLHVQVNGSLQNFAVSYLPMQ